MRRYATLAGLALLWLYLAYSLEAQGQTTTTITGTIRDLTQALVTSGKVTFTLQPGKDTTISGVARFTPAQVVCLINGSGLIKAQDGTSVCTITMNTALQPTGTYYRVDLWPGNVKTSSFTFYAVLASYDWSTVVPTPTTSPAQNFVDIFSNQTIGGNKTWSGTQIFSGAQTFNGAVTETATHTLTNAGVFSNAQMNEYVQSIIGTTCDPTTVWQSAQPGNTATDGVLGLVCAPSNATVHQVNGLSGMVANASPTTFGVGLYGYGFSTAVGAQAEGANLVAETTTGKPAIAAALELNTNCNNATDQCFGLTWNGVWNTQPTTAALFNVSQPGGAGGTLHWQNGIVFAGGTTFNTCFGGGSCGAIVLNQEGVAGAGHDSQQILFNSSSHGGGIRMSDSLNALVLNTNANIQGSVGIGGPVTSVNNIATVGLNGISAEYAGVDLTAQTAAITTTTLYAVPSSGAGQYRLSWNAKVTTAAGVSSTLGALTIVYTDPDGVAQTITAPASIAAGTIATTSTGNSTTTVLLGLPLLLNCKASTNVTYAFAYASNAASAMNYNLHIKLEAM